MVDFLNDGWRPGIECRTLPEDANVVQKIVDGEKSAESGRKSTEATAEPSMASPRSIPVPDIPANPGRPDPPPSLEDTGDSSASFGRKCVPFEVPECEC